MSLLSVLFRGASPGRGPGVLGPGGVVRTAGTAVRTAGAAAGRAATTVLTSPATKGALAAGQFGVSLAGALKKPPKPPGTRKKDIQAQQDARRRVLARRRGQGRRGTQLASQLGTPGEEDRTGVTRSRATLLGS